MLQFFLLSAPLFAIVLVGYGIGVWPRWRRSWTNVASKAVFTVLLPALLFHLLSDLSKLPPVDARLLIAFFGGCLIVFVIGRVVAARVFHLDGVSQSIFGLGGIFSNNVLLGLPLAKLTLGDRALPSVVLVLVFNSLTLWTLVSVSIEWAQHGSFTIAGFGKTALSLLKNPIVVAILAGTLFGLSGLALPDMIGTLLSGLSELAAPAALLVLGMGLAEYGIRSGWQQSIAITVLKLLVQPLVVWMIGAALGLPAMELKVVVLLASMSVGVNVYLMSAQFQTLQSAVASSLVLSTALAALTTPALMTALNALVR
jgi:predicted permease